MNSDLASAITPPSARQHGSCVPERHHADGVEREPLEHVLQVDDDSAAAGAAGITPQQREQPAGDLGLHDVDDELA
jgi:hypothetical protein